MKNKKQLILPSTQTFTIKELFAVNPTEKEITTRVRFSDSEEKESGKIIEFGALSGGKGRPEKVFAFTPITKIMLAKAKFEKINLADGLERTVVG